MHEGSREAGDDTHEDDHRDTVAYTLVGNFLTQPHDEHGTRSHDNRQEYHGERSEVDLTAGAHHLILQVDEVGGSLNEQDEHGEVTCVLVQLHATTLALTLHLLKARIDHAHKLDHNRCSDVGHDAQCENGSLGEGAAREHVEQLHQSAVGELVQRGKVGRADSRQDHKASKSIHKYEKECDDNALPEILNLPDIL